MNYESTYELIRNLTILFATLMLIKYTLFLLVAPFHNVKESLRALRLAKRRRFPYKPLVSVIIPAWNEEVGIVPTIRSVMHNSYPRIEIIVINDGSTDNTHDVIVQYVIDMKRYTEQSGKTLFQGKSFRYYKKINEGKGTALNHAIKRAHGDIIVTIDADSIADHQMVANIVKYFEDETIDAVVGNVRIAGEVTFLNLLQRLEFLFGFYHKRAHSLLGAEYIYGGACAAFRKKTVFDKIGLFDTSNITEDIELSMRTRTHGCISVFAHDAICYTEGANTTLGLVKQRTRWKKGRFTAFSKYKRMFFSTNIKHNKWLTWYILPLALLGDLQLLFEPIGITLLILYSYITGDFSSLVLGALFMWIIFIVVGLFTEKARNWWIIPLAPFTWMIFYALVWVEYMALMRSLVSIIRSEAVAWQRWQRKGIALKKQSDNKL